MFNTTDMKTDGYILGTFNTLFMSKIKASKLLHVSYSLCSSVLSKAKRLVGVGFLQEKFTNYKCELRRDNSSIDSIYAFLVN